jgi:hypothetical protein
MSYSYNIPLNAVLQSRYRCTVNDGILEVWKGEVSLHDAHYIPALWVLMRDHGRREQVKRGTGRGIASLLGRITGAVAAGRLVKIS